MPLTTRTFGLRVLSPSRPCLVAFVHIDDGGSRALMESLVQAAWELALARSRGSESDSATCDNDGDECGRACAAATGRPRSQPPTNAAKIAVQCRRGGCRRRRRAWRAGAGCGDERVDGVRRPAAVRRLRTAAGHSVARAEGQRRAIVDGASRPLRVALVATAQRGRPPSTRGGLVRVPRRAAHRTGHRSGRPGWWRGTCGRAMWRRAGLCGGTVLPSVTCRSRPSHGDAAAVPCASNGEQRRGSRLQHAPWRHRQALLPVFGPCGVLSRPAAVAVTPAVRLPWTIGNPLSRAAGA